MRLDSSAARLAGARRLAQQTDAEGKLGVLQRLQRRYVECNLPREGESRVEQSFNEQLFAKVLGYRTLLSHDRLPFHLRPKNYAKAVRRFDDVSLGVFWGDDERDIVLASAEFKDPGTDLDAPQTDREDKISAVAQAFRAARGFPRCQWVIVSNFRELRLYALPDESEPLAVFDLHEVRTRGQLAVLAAHCDYDALVGVGGKPGMTTALDPIHPSAPLPGGPDAFRVVCTFTPTGGMVSFRLSAIYDAVRDVATAHLNVPRDPIDRTPKLPVRVEDGWASVECDGVRLAASVEGQVRCSIRNQRTCGPAQVNPDAGFWRIARDLHRFTLMVDDFYKAVHVPGVPKSGLLSFELRETLGWQLLYEGKDLFRKNDITNCGIADTANVFSGDVVWLVGKDFARTSADCMGELALHFRSVQGTRVRFDHAALASLLDASTSRATMSR